ncbi:MAG: hypothetical protein KJO94_08040 [Eudoraea sp.]|nr:hypothetical protein [Eudoraea sp.]
MEKAQLTDKQTFLINEVMEEIELYKEELQRQIKNARFNLLLGIGIAVVIGILLIFQPTFLAGIMEKLRNLSANMEVIGSLVGEGIPVLFGLKSLNNSKEQKKRLKGVRVFEKDLKRMQEGIISNSEDQILNLEKEFSRYINT